MPRRYRASLSFAELWRQRRGSSAPRDRKFLSPGRPTLTRSPSTTLTYMKVITSATQLEGPRHANHPRSWGTVACCSSADRGPPRFPTFTHHLRLKWSGQGEEPYRLQLQVSPSVRPLRLFAPALRRRPSLSCFAPWLSHLEPPFSPTSTSTPINCEKRRSRHAFPRIARCCSRCSRRFFRRGCTSPQCRRHRRRRRRSRAEPHRRARLHRRRGPVQHHLPE